MVKQKHFKKVVEYKRPFSFIPFIVSFILPSLIFYLCSPFNNINLFLFGVLVGSSIILVLDCLASYFKNSNRRVYWEEIKDERNRIKKTKEKKIMNKIKIKEIFKLRLESNSVLMFLILLILVLFYKMFSSIALQDIVGFRSYLSNLIQTDIYMSLTFIVFWTSIYLCIMYIGIIISPINIFASFLLSVSIFVDGFIGEILIALSMVPILIGIIIPIIDIFKKSRRRK